MDIVKAFAANNLEINITVSGSYDDPLFRAGDIGEVLGMSNIRSHITDFDESEKVVKHIDTRGGNQSVTFLTEKGLYKILFKSNKPIAKQFQDWVCDVIKEIRLKGKYDLEQKLQQHLQEIQNKENIIQQKTLENQALEEECENLRNCNDGVPIVYIYDTDTRVFSTGTKDLKIGITEHYRKRSKPFKGVTPFGRMVFSMEVPLTNLRIAEKWLHTILAPYHTANEMFKMDPEEARMWIIREINTLKLANNTNWSDKHGKLSKLIEMERKILEGEIANSIATREISTQTDDKLPSINENDDHSKFDKFIRECCVLTDKAQVSSTDIIGRYRLWARSADKETFHAILDYLKKRFVPCRLRIQDKNTVVNGFSGVEIKADPIVLSCAPSEAERFVYANFNYTPSGKILMADLIKEYEKWIKTQAGTFSQDDIKLLKDFLKSNPRILVSNLWTENGSGQGYYGIQLKSKENHHRKTSSTAKKIEKRDKNGSFLKAWTSIAKAAEDEGVGAATMSRCVKNKKVMEDGSYYVSV